MGRTAEKTCVVRRTFLPTIIADDHVVDHFLPAVLTLRIAVIMLTVSQTDGLRVSSEEG